MVLGNSTEGARLVTNGADIIGTKVNPTNKLANITRIVITENPDKGLRHFISIILTYGHQMIFFIKKISF